MVEDKKIKERIVLDKAELALCVAEVKHIFSHKDIKDEYLLIIKRRKYGIYHLCLGSGKDLYNNTRNYNQCLVACRKK